MKFVTGMIETESFSRSFHKIFQLEVEQRVSCRQLFNYNAGINCNITIFAPQQKERLLPMKEKVKVRQF